VSDWDQFETNKRLFNVRSSFNEDLYTKKLDLASMSKEQIARADRIAKEIEGSSSRYSRLMLLCMDRYVDGWIGRSI
jgi:PAB1-binding protein PBP1